MSAEWKLLDNSKVYNHKVIPILTKEESKNLIRWHKSHKHLTSVGSGEDYFGIRKIHINNEYIRLLFQKVETHCTAEIYKATGKVFYPEMSTMTEWPIGGFQDPHLDTYSHQEREDEDYLQRYSADKVKLLAFFFDKFGHTWLHEGLEWLQGAGNFGRVCCTCFWF